MFYLYLKEGLGNQLFQYACGRALSLRYNQPLKIHTGSYETNTFQRDYALEPFNIKAEFMTQEEWKCLTCKYKAISPIKSLCLALMGKQTIQRINEPHLSFNKSLENLDSRKSYLINGFWQSEKYFSDYAGEIRNDLTFSMPPNKDNQKVLDKIQSKKVSVSLHIRRGDYVASQSVNQIHGLLDPEYYHSAIKYLRNKYEKFHCFIFTDDPEWVINNFNIQAPLTIISHNLGNKSHEDLRLMSQCDHHILANSSFGWWGAWLNDTPGKTVIAPKYWFRSEERNNETLVPDNWIKIENTFIDPN